MNITDVPFSHSTVPLASWDSEYWIQWHHQNWTISFWFSLAYIVSVFLGQQYMANRKSYVLRKFLAFWSASLAVFSLLGLYSIVPTFVSVLLRKGFHSTACENHFSRNPSFLFWGWLFTWSKVLEFADTMFIILRKQKLLFLHWYHHALTVICVFAFFPTTNPINHWTSSMNLTVHSLMYTYYALRASGYRMPKPVAAAITTLQIAQMVIGCFVASYQLAKKVLGHRCETTMSLAIFVFASYFSYFLLFVNFYIQAYLRQPPSMPIKFPSLSCHPLQSSPFSATEDLRPKTD